MPLGRWYGLDSDGNLWAWGTNDLGELGNGTTGGTSAVPVAVTTPAAAPGGFVAVAGGAGVGYGLDSDGNAYAWGWNLFGQLGDGSFADSNVPVPVTMPPGVSFTAVAGGGYTGYGLASDGRIYGWGFNSDGQLGAGNIISNVPVPVVLPAGAGPGFRFVAVSGGLYSAYGLGNDGVIYAWGSNSSGQLGNGSGVDSTVPVPVTTPATAPAGFEFVALDAGAYWGLGLGSDGVVYGWGDNSNGLLGDGTTTARPTPVAAVGPKAVVATVVFGSTAGTGLTQDDDTWQATTPGGCGPVDVSVTYSYTTAPGTNLVDTVSNGFTYGSAAGVSNPTPTVTDTTVTATVTVTGDSTPGVQWQSSTGGAWTNLSGQTTGTLSVARPTVATSYRAVATNCWTGEAISGTFTVQPADSGFGGSGGSGGSGDTGKKPGAPGKPMPPTGASGIYLGLWTVALLLSAGAVLLVARVRRDNV